MDLPISPSAFDVPNVNSTGCSKIIAKLKQLVAECPSWSQLTSAAKWKVGILGFAGGIFTGVGVAALIVGAGGLSNPISAIPALGLLVGGAAVTTIGVIFLAAAAYCWRTGGDSAEMVVSSDDDSEVQDRPKGDSYIVVPRSNENFDPNHRYGEN